MLTCIFPIVLITNPLISKFMMRGLAIIGSNQIHPYNCQVLSSTFVDDIDGDYIDHDYIDCDYIAGYEFLTKGQWMHFLSRKRIKKQNFSYLRGRESR
jgi:hypothetical protein